MQNLFAVLAGVVAVLAPAPCFAATCPVEVEGEGTEAWSLAAAAVSEDAREEKNDCARIRIELIEERARLTFTTADGRVAERELADPEELAPTLQALLVTGAATAAPGTAPAPPTAREPARAPPEADRGPVESATPARHDSTPTLAFLAGARGGESKLVSPVLRASAALALDRWELGVLGGFDLHYGHVPEQSAPPADTWAWLAGVSVGRREPLGGLAFVGGGRLMLAALAQEGDAEGPRDQGRAELRLGAYGGLVLPRRAAWRFRADLGAEIVPHDAGTDTPTVARTPATPWWTASLMLGIETGGT